MSNPSFSYHYFFINSEIKHIIGDKYQVTTSDNFGGDDDFSEFDTEV